MTVVRQEFRIGRSEHLLANDVIETIYFLPAPRAGTQNTASLAELSETFLNTQLMPTNTATTSSENLTSELGVGV